MYISLQELKAGLRDGRLTVCLPPAHEDFTTSFLEEFSEYILGADWRVVGSGAHQSLVEFAEDESEDELIERVQFVYGVDVSDLPGLPLWPVMRRCANHRFPRHFE